MTFIHISIIYCIVAIIKLSQAIIYCKVVIFLLFILQKKVSLSQVRQALLL